MKHKILKHLTKYILPALALAIAVPVATAFLGSEGKTRVLADTTSGQCGDNVEWSFDSETGSMTISGTGDMYDYDKEPLPWNDFKGEITSVQIQSGVTSLCDSSFKGCSNITSLTIGSGVTSIGESAFYDCTGLTEVVIPGSVTSIGKSAFAWCENISSLTIGTGVTSIGESAFKSCTGLTEVIIPGSVTSIGKSAFQGCSNISNLTIGSGVTSIGESAFKSCTGLTEVVIPNNVTSIGKSAFDWCENISSLTIGTGVTSIGESAFKSCTGLTEVVIPGSVTSMGESAFRGCENITRLTIEEGVTSVGGFYGCTGLTEVVIPESVTSIGKSAFQGCTNITNLTIGGGVTSIGESAFRSCTGLTALVIPESVTDIGQNAFYGSSNITDVYCFADPAPLTWDELGCNDFSRTAGMKTVCHVCPEYLQTYQEKFDKVVNVEFVGDLLNEVDLGLGAMLKGYSLSLEGDIGVKFYMDLDSVDLSTNPYMEFTVPNGSKTETQIVTLAQAGTATVGEKTYYTFKCKVSAKDASSTIQAQLVAGEDKSKIYDFSVKSYAEYIIACKDLNEQYEKATPLAKALLTYCACAQSYFGTNPSTLDTTCIDQSALDQVTADSMGPIPTVSIDINSSTGVTFVGATLSLKSETTLSLYFKSDMPLSFSCYHMTVENEIVGEYQVARIRGIKAGDIGKLYTLAITEDTDGPYVMNVGQVSYSVLNYCYNVVNGGDAYGDDLQNVVKSLYLYYEAAKTYTP